MTVTEQIWSEYDNLMNYAKRFIKDKDTRHDFVMDTIDRAISKEHHFTSGTRIKCWLICILHNQFTSSKRKMINKLTMLTDELPDINVCFNDAISEFEIEEIKNAILDTNNELQNEVLMRYISGEKRKHIAADLEEQFGGTRAESKIGAMIRQSRTKVKKYLDK